MKTYFVIHASEGQISIDQYNEAELLERITPDDEGTTWYGPDLVFRTGPFDLEDPAYWQGNELVIIEGRVIHPVPVAVALRYTLE